MLSVLRPARPVTFVKLEPLADRLNLSIGGATGLYTWVRID